jgi:hypothetical protein
LESYAKQRGVRVIAWTVSTVSGSIGMGWDGDDELVSGYQSASRYYYGFPASMLWESGYWPIV